MSTMIDIIGKLHPLLVHLPIGMIIIAIFMEWISEIKNYASLNSSSRFILTVAWVMSVLSLVSGYVLSLENTNDPQDVDLHKWFAICTSVFLLIQLLCWKYTRPIKLLHHGLLFILLILLSVTGHLGGELTHGKGYLQIQEKNSELVKIEIPPIDNIQQAAIYDDITKYIIMEKCESCHGKEHQKGKLRLDNIENILKGGKSGKSIDFSNYAESELLKRIHLDANDEHHMPPKKELQLTLNEIKLLEWWVANKCIADKKISDVPLDSSILNVLSNYQKVRNEHSNVSHKQRNTVQAITSAQKEKLMKCGLIVTPISAEDNHIRVTAFNLEKPIPEALSALEAVKNQLIELKFGNRALTKIDLQKITSFPLLEKLWINNAEISDKSLPEFKQLNNLVYLNVSGNKLSKQSLEVIIKSLPKLEVIIAYDISLTTEEKNDLKKLFKGNQMSLGRDSMTTVLSDTLFTKNKN